jgi:hypothetical protein
MAVEVSDDASMNVMDEFRARSEIAELNTRSFRSTATKRWEGST